MERNKLIWGGMIIGTTLGGYIPSLWSDSVFSMSSVFTTAIGGFLGIWIAYKLGQY